MQLGPDISGTELIEGGPLVALVRRPQAAEGPAPAQGSPALVLIHGFGANETDIYELVSYVDRRVLVVAPRGPMKVDDNPRGSWRWSINRDDGKPDPAVLQESTAKVADLVRQLSSITGVKVDQAQVYVGGFSQGGLMSLEMASRYPDLLAGILPQSGFTSPEAEQNLRAGAFQGKPAFVVHGTRDTILPVERGRKSKEILEAGGVDLTYKEYNFGHVTSPESRRELANWLNPRLKF
jgi:phospholipase/carboxylesterase